MKNIIAITSLLAAGTLCASAAETLVRGTVVKSLLDGIVSSQYSSGDAYTLSFTLSDFGNVSNTNKLMLTLDTDYYLISQLDGGGPNRYFGLSNTPGDAPAASGFTFTSDGNNRTLISASSTLPLGWISKTANGNNSESRVLSGATKIEIASDGTSSSLTLSYGGSNLIVDSVIFTDTDLALSNILFSEYLQNASMYNASLVLDGTTYTLIPEPSAFGLLAGLGALALAGTRRRRRK